VPALGVHAAVVGSRQLRLGVSVRDGIDRSLAATAKTVSSTTWELYDFGGSFRWRGDPLVVVIETIDFAMGTGSISIDDFAVNCVGPIGWRRGRSYRQKTILYCHLGEPAVTRIPTVPPQRS